MSARPSGLAHVFTVDLEEYYHAHALQDDLDESRYRSLPSRVEESTDRLLLKLDQHEVRATFFVLGCLARRVPEVISAIAEAGHEVAAHGMSHRRITEMTREEFRSEVRESRETLEKITGRPVRGFRAPSFSVTPETKWAFRILVEEGYRYDSSVFPIRLFHYGYPGASRHPSLVTTPAGGIVELPLTTLKLAGVRLPAAGGAYLRHFPYSLSRAALQQAEEDRRSAVVYCHPWELDPGQPRLDVGWSSRFRQYRGLERMTDRLDRLLGEFQFVSAAGYLDRFGPVDETQTASAPTESSRDEATAKEARANVAVEKEAR